MSSRSAICWKVAAAASRLPASCAACALSSKVSGSFGAMRLASVVNFLAARASPEPTAISPFDTAWKARTPRRLRRKRETASGERTMARAIDHSSTAATATAAAAAISTMTEVSTRSPCQVMTTSPGRSASHTAPNASNATMTR